MTTLTVICREDGYFNDILIYSVEVENPEDEDEVKAAVQEERNNDLEDEANEMEVLFAFEGDLKTRADWRQ